MSDPREENKEPSPNSHAAMLTPTTSQVGTSPARDPAGVDTEMTHQISQFNPA